MSNAQTAITNFLLETINKKCRVILTSGSIHIGTLCSIDGLFNLVLQDSIEYFNNVEVHKNDSIFIRGNCVINVAPVSE